MTDSRVEGNEANVQRDLLLELWAELGEILRSRSRKAGGVRESLREIDVRIAERADELGIPAGMLDRMLVGLDTEGDR